MVGNYQDPVQTRPILFYYWHSNHYTLDCSPIYHILYCTVHGKHRFILTSAATYVRIVSNQKDITPRLKRQQKKDKKSFIKKESTYRYFLFCGGGMDGWDDRVILIIYHTCGKKGTIQGNKIRNMTTSVIQFNTRSMKYTSCQASYRRFLFFLLSYCTT